MLPEDLIAAIDRIATNRLRLPTDAAWKLVGDEPFLSPCEKAAGRLSMAV